MMSNEDKKQNPREIISNKINELMTSFEQKRWQTPNFNEDEWFAESREVLNKTVSELDIDPKILTEIYLAEFENNSNIIELIPKSQRNVDICLAVITNVFFKIEKFAKDVQLHPKVHAEIIKIARRDAQVVIDLPEHLKTKDIYLAGLENAWQLVGYVPDNLIDDVEFKIHIQKALDETKNILKDAENNKQPISLKFIPKKYRDAEICLALAEYDCKELRFFPDELLNNKSVTTDERFKNAFDKSSTSVEVDGENLLYVPKQLLTYELCLTGAEKARKYYTKDIFAHIPKPYRDLKICKALFETSLEIEPIRNFKETTELTPDQFKDLCRSIVEKNGESLQSVPVELIDVDMCLAAILNDEKAFEFVPKPFRSVSFCNAAIEKNPKVIGQIGKYLATTEFSKDEYKGEYKKLCVALLKTNGAYLNLIPQDYRDEDLCVTAVKNDLTAFEFVPRPQRNLSFFVAIMGKFPNILEKIGNYQESTNLKDFDEYKTLCLAILRQHGEYLKYIIPEELRDQDMCETAIKKYPYAFEFVPEPLYLSCCKVAIKKNIWIFQSIAKHQKTTALNPDDYKELCVVLAKEAALQHQNYMSWIPKDVSNYQDICLAILEQDESIFKDLPKEYLNFISLKKITEKRPEIIKKLDNYQKTTDLKDFDEYKALCLIVLKQQGNYLEFIPENLRDTDMCLTAVENDLLAFQFVPAPLRDYAFCKTVIEKNPLMMRMIRNHRAQTSLTMDEYKNLVYPEHHDTKYFAMLNNAVAVTDTKLEGGNNSESLAYYHYLLNFEMPADCPLELTLTTQQKDALYHGITDLIQIQDLLEDSDDSGILNTKDGLNKIIDAIITNTKQSGVCYLPSGWTGEPSGHFAGLKVRRLENDRFAFSIINHGGGIQYHRKVSNTGGKDKYIYQSDEYAVDLQSDNGRKLLQQLLELQFDSQRKSDVNKVVKQYSADDLYGLLNLYGKEIPLTDKLSEKVVTPQRSGTCTVTNLHAMARDILIDNGADIKTRKRYHFILKLRSIIAGFAAYEQGQCPHNVMEWALREFATRINKEYRNVLNENEMIYCSQLHQKIEQRLNHDKKASIKEKCKVQPLPDLAGEAPIYKDKLFPTIKQEMIAETKPSEVKAEVATPSLAIRPENMVTLLKFEKKKEEANAAETAQTFDFEKMHDLFNSLPHCTGLAQDPFWDHVPKEDIGEIIKNLSQIVAKLTSHSQSKSSLTRARTLAMSLMAYDIATQLVSRYGDAMDNPFKLGGQFAFGFDDVYSEQNFFTDPIAYYTVKHIAKNFQERSQGKARVLTNAVNYANNKHDKTAHYIINVVLTEEQRSALAAKLKEKTGSESTKFSDEELFAFLMKNIKLKYKNDTEYILDETVAAMLSLSATAHNLGHFSEVYETKEKSAIWFFNDNQFHHELARQAELQQLDIAKHLPQISASKQPGDYQDWSENAIYHPHNNKKNLQEEFKKDSWKSGVEYSPKVQLHPYQLYLAGSLNPDSNKWELSLSELKLIYEKLDEDFRHIECTPDLQIVRTLAWAKTNLNKLLLPDVRDRINQMIFRYGQLDHAYAFQLEPTLLNMQGFFSAILTYCKEEAPDEIDLLAWAAVLAQDMRYHLEVAAKFYKLPLNKTLPSFRDLLLEKMISTQDNNVRSTLASIVVCEFRNTHPMSLDDYCLAFVCRMVANLGDSSGISDELWNKLNKELLTLISNDDNQNQFIKKLNQLLPIYLKLPVNQEWRLAHPQLVAQDSEYVIDLATGSLQKHGNQMKERTSKTIEENKQLFTDLQLIDTKDFMLLYSQLSKEKVLESRDGRFQFFYSADSLGSRGMQFRIFKTQQIVNIEKTPATFKLLDSKKELEDLFKEQKIQNPFESNSVYQTHYQYWQSLDDKSLLFVIDKKNKDIAYCYSLKDGVISQLAVNKAGEWDRNGKLLLNLTAGLQVIEDEKKAQEEIVTTKKTIEVHATPLEKKWVERLNPLFGVKNVRCTAIVSDDKASCRVQRIEHLTLGLNFTVNDQQQLMCDNIPGYFLSEQQSIEALQGLPSIIILQNDQGDKKYFLPAFALNPGEKNNAFNQEEIFDMGNLCNPSQPYYALKLNDKQELVGDSLEANLYLAIVYRSLGDFKRAMQYLAHCKTSTNINAATAAIATQVLIRKIESPLAAAFDLKLECFLREHQQKWSKDNEQVFAPVEFPEKWDKLIKKQLEFYKKTFSNYKMGVAIIPNYCRLTDEEFKWLGQTPKKKKTVSDRAKKSAKAKGRIAKASRLSELILGEGKTDWRGRELTWRNHVESLRDKIKSSLTQKANLTDTLSTLRTYDNSRKTPGFDYLIVHFANLFDDALSSNNHRVDQLHKTLFSLLQNDTNVEEELFSFIALLAFTSKYPHYFHDFKKPTDTVELLIQVGEIFHQHNTDLNNVTVPLFAPERTVDQITIAKPLPSDHVAELVTYQPLSIQHEDKLKYPLKHIADNHFIKKTDQTVAKREFALQLSDDATLIEKRLFADYEKGHKENQNKVKVVYEAVQGFNLDLLKDDLEEFKKEDKKYLKQLESSLLQRANHLPIDHPLGSVKTKAHNVLIARASEELDVISISDLFTAFLQRDPTLLTKQNPFLTQQDVSQLFDELANYALLHSRMDQANEALQIIGDKKLLNEIEPYQQQLLASTLNKPRAYKIAGFPEFLVYEYATKRLLREDQANAIKKIIQLIESEPNNVEAMRHCLLQFAAGGGKTAVLIPILAQRFAQAGFLPIIFNTQELYKTGLKDIPKNLRASFKQNMEVVDRELDFEWTEENLTKLRDDLERWRKEKKCVLLKPVTWHAINIAMKSEYIKGNVRLATAAKSVLDFFKTQCVKLEDECHLVSDPLQQSIKTFGNKKKIPDKQLNLLLKYYDYLIGHAKNSSQIAELAGINPKRDDPISKPELAEIQKMLAQVIVNEAAFKDIAHDDLLAYLLQPESNRTRPKWLVDLHDRRIENPRWKEFEQYYDDEFKERHPNWKTIPDEKAQKLADLVILARAFINTHLPHIVSLQDQKDYGDSIHAGDLTAAPKHEGKDVSSHYGDHTLVAALTIQMYHQRGLAPAQLEQLFAKLMDEHAEERRWNTNTDVPTLAELWLLKFIPEKYSFSCYRDLTAELKTHLTKDPNFFKNPEIIKNYLLEFALPQIDVPEQQQTSTAAELQAGFTRSILLSATPSVPEIYPAFLKPENCFLEKAFEAQVIDTLLDAKNIKHYKFNEIKTPEEFFDQFPPELLNEMTTLIDRGALLTDFDAKDVVGSYLDLLKPRITQTGAYFAKGKGEDQMHLVTREPKDKVKQRFDIAGSALVEALEEQGLSKKFILLLFLDLSKTTGIDIKRPHKDRAGLTVGKGQTVTETIQAAMRERQLLEDDAQTVAWLMFKSLYKAIDPKASAEDSFDPNKLFCWMIKNEAQEIETKLINRAYQGIDQALIGIAWQNIAENYDEYSAKKLRQYQDSSPWEIYEINSTKQDTKEVLNAYVKQKLSGIQNEYSKRKIIIPKDVQERIDKIIAETAALIDQLYTPAKKALNDEVQQEMKLETTTKKEQKSEERQKLRLDTTSSFIFANEHYSLKEDNFKVIFDKKAQQDAKRYQALQLPECQDIKQPELIFCQKHFAVMQEAAKKNATALEELKPIKLLLVKIMPDRNMEYLACTAHGANYYSRLLNDDSLTEKDPAYALMTVEGEILCTSNNIIPDQAKQLTETEDCQRMLTYANFLNGKITNPNYLSQIIKEYGWTKAQYEKVADAIANVHVSQHSVSLLANQTLERLCGWQKKKSQAPLTGVTSTVNKRYRKPETRSVTTAKRSLQAEDNLDKAIDYSLPPLSSKQRALEGYLFDEKPSPVAKETGELELTLMMKNIQSFANKHQIVGKDQALAHLNHLSLQIFKSLRTNADKVKVIEELYTQFKEFDEFLEAFNNKLINCTDAEYVILIGKAQNAIKQAYLSFAKGKPISDCVNELKNTLQAATSATKDKLQYEKSMKFVGTELVAAQFSNSELAIILEQAATELAKAKIYQHQ